MYKYLTLAEGEGLMSKYNSSLGILKIGEILSKEAPRVHFSGVGGVGMYSLFCMSRDLGYIVSGSDLKNSTFTERLLLDGEEICIGHNAENAADKDLIVYSLALDERNPELLYASLVGIPCISRAEYLAYLLSLKRCKIGVSGSHGKSSVTAILKEIFEAAKLSPTVIAGARLPHSDEPYISGGNEVAIYEACEYKDSFLCLPCDIAVFTNLELDHTDYFKTLDDIKRSFTAAMNRAPLSIINIDDENLNSIKPLSKGEVLTYAIEREADFSAAELECSGGVYSFKLFEKGRPVSKIKMSVPGKYMVYNALAAISAARAFGVDAKICSAAVSEYRGLERRFELVATLGDAPVIYDYAHHPTEIKSVIECARDVYDGEITVVFKPHTYTRTRDLWDGFVSSLSLADRVLILPIDGIREREIAGISAENLARALGSSCKCIEERELESQLEKISGAVLLLGAASLDAALKYFQNKNRVKP